MAWRLRESIALLDFTDSSRTCWSCADAFLGRRRVANLGNKLRAAISCALHADPMSRTYANVVIEFHPSRAVQFHFSQGLSDNVVRLFLGRLHGLYRGRLVQVSFVVDVQLSKCILQSEDVALLKLGVLPAFLLARFESDRCTSCRNEPLQLDDIHDRGT